MSELSQTGLERKPTGTSGDSMRLPQGWLPPNALTDYSVLIYMAAVKTLSGSPKSSELPSPPVDCDFTSVKKYVGELRQFVAVALSSTLWAAHLEILKHLAPLLNRDQWATVRTEHWSSPGTAPYTSSVVPLNREFAALMPGAHSFHRFGSGGKSSLSQSFPCSEVGTPAALPNGWFTTFERPDGGKLFEGFRSGSLVHHGELCAEMRRRVADSGANELLLAATTYAFARLDPSNGLEIIDRRRPLEVSLVTLDLQSTGVGPEQSVSIENWIVPEARAAMRRLESVRTVELTFPGGDSVVPLSIDVAVTVLPFNFPTHHYSFRSGTGLDRYTKAVNDESWSRLLASPGWNTINGFDRFKADRLLQDLHEPIATSSLDPRADPYGVNSRLAVLAYLLGHVVHFNCRSGKDRTGMMDAEVKFVASQLDKNVLSGFGDSLSAEQSQFLADLAVRAGSAKIQQLNTGVQGSKLRPIVGDSPHDPLMLRIGLERWEDFKGFAGLAKL